MSISPVFEVRDSGIQGRGIFATRGIEKGEEICTFTGTRISIPELKVLYRHGEERLDDPLQIGEQEYMDIDEPYVNFNHSCAPSAGMRGVGTLFALHDIAKGEEITFDYSTSEWSDDEAWGEGWQWEWQFACRCKAPNCRKVIREFRFLSPDVQQFYLKQGAVMDFITVKMNT